MKIDKYIYFAKIIENSDSSYTIIFTEFNDCITITDKCNDVTDVTRKAKEILELYLWSMEEKEIALPKPNKPEKIILNKGEFLTPICVYMPDVREKMNNKATKKTLTIPYWLNKIAEKEKINFSELLQNALKKELNINIEFIRKFIK